MDEASGQGKTESGRAPKGLISRVKTSARALRRDAHAIFLASRDPRVPWAVKLLALAVAGYALSPIDLIPDFIPVLGYLDDLTIVPLGIWLVIALIPKDVMDEYRTAANAAATRRRGPNHSDRTCFNPGRLLFCKRAPKAIAGFGSPSPESTRTCRSTLPASPFCSFSIGSENRAHSLRN